MEIKRPTLEAGKMDGGAALTVIRLEAQPAHFIQPFLSPCLRQGGNVIGFGRKANEGSRLITCKLG